MDLQTKNILFDEDEYTVVVCCRNAEETIFLCAQSIIRARVKNILIIDGHSEDSTQTKLKNMGLDFKLGTGMGLSADRQLAIDCVKTRFTFFIDADHLISNEFFSKMMSEYLDNKADFVQSKLRIFNPKNFLNKGEDEYYRIFHNSHWNKKMIGLAPSLFETKHLKTGAKWQLYSDNSKIIDDTSWAKRASDSGARFAVVNPEVFQIHSPSVFSYLKKFFWYGKGDGDFILEFPNRSISMLLHLCFRYPVIFGLNMLLRFKFHGFFYVVIQGFTRLISCLFRIISIQFANKVGKRVFNGSRSHPSD